MSWVKLRHWSHLAQVSVHSRSRLSYRALLAALIVAAVVAVVAFFSVGQAQGSGEQDSTTLGLGTSQQVAEGSGMTPAQRAAAESSTTDEHGVTEASETAAASDSAQRSITVKDPDPVVVPVAIDESNPTAVEKAMEVCTLDPLPTAPRVAPDLSDGTWESGVASAYSVSSNDDGQGNFGVTDTASGIDLHNNSITVAVPESRSSLLNRVVEICYDGKVVIATVTDTGGFAKYGRDLDLAPGVYKAFGFDSYAEWGTRTVSYRFL